jgi:hypothetical protein
LALTAVGVASGASVDQCRDAGAVLEAIAQKGAQALVKEALEPRGEPTCWHAILAGIEGGEGKWLEVAEGTISATQSGASQELRIAVGRALEHNAVGVLGLVKRGTFDSAEVCGYEGVEDGLLGVSFEEALAEVERRRAAVAAIRAESLLREAAQCQRWLRKLSQTLRIHRKDWFGGGVLPRG